MKNKVLPVRWISSNKTVHLRIPDRSITIMKTSDVDALICAINSIPNDPEELLDIEGVRLLLGGGGGKKAAKSTVDNWRRDGILPFIKIGKGRNAAVRYPRKDVLAALHANKVDVRS